MSLCDGLNREQANALYSDVLEAGDTNAMRQLCREDLFFLLVIACNRKDMQHDWIYDRCREIEKEPDGYLDLWAREHYKSTIITFGKTIQDILNNPDVTVGIFSHTRPNAKGFLSQIKKEFEDDNFLKELFPDVLYKEPKKEAPTWSIDGGIVVKRSSNPKENTVEAWGLVDGQPTSKHFSLMVFDDVVTLESITSPEMMGKVTTAWETSLNLGARGGAVRYIGTRYHFNDTYKTIMDRQAATPRIYTATTDGTLDTAPVLLTREQLDKKRREMGSYTFSCQMLQNPTADKAMGFKPEWLRFYDKIPDSRTMNIYLLVDPAGGKKKSNDYTVMNVIGLGIDGNYYLLDAIRDRLNLTERTKKLFELVRKWKPKQVGYEKYGLQADIEHMRYVMEQESYRFNIMGLGGSMPKNDRIRKLVPIHEEGRFYYPHRLLFISAEGKVVDYVHEFITYEYTAFPVGEHDDMLDCEARIVDPELKAVFPKAVQTQGGKPVMYTGNASSYKAI